MSDPLSPQGCARRDELLGELLGSMERLHERRRKRRGQRRHLVAAACLVAIGGVVAMLVPTASVEMTGAIVETPRAAGVERWNFATVETDPTVLDRYRVAPTTRAMVVDDETLLGALAAIDRPTGLVRRGDRVWFTNDVLAPR